MSSPTNNDVPSSQHPSRAHDGTAPQFLLAASALPSSDGRAQEDHHADSAKRHVGHRHPSHHRSGSSVSTESYEKKMKAPIGEAEGRPCPCSSNTKPQSQRRSRTAQVEWQDADALNAPKTSAAGNQTGSLASSSSKQHRSRSHDVAVPAAIVTTSAEATASAKTSDPALLSDLASAPLTPTLTTPAHTSAVMEIVDTSVADPAAATPGRCVSREVLQMPSVLDAMSLHSASGTSLHSPPCVAVLRGRDGADHSAILGSMGPGSNFLNTVSSRSGVNAQAERTPVLGSLPCSSRILGREDGGASFARDFATVPAQAAPSLLDLEPADSYASGSGRTPLLWLPSPPQMRPRSPNMAGSSIAAVQNLENARGGATAAAAVLFAPPLPSVTAAVRRARDFSGSINTSDVWMALSGSTSHSHDTGAQRCPGPRGRRQKCSATVGSLTNVLADSAGSTSLVGPYGAPPLPLDGAQLQVRLFPSTPSPSTVPGAVTATNPHSSPASHFSDAHTWATRANSANSRSVTGESTGGAAVPRLTPRFATGAIARAAATEVVAPPLVVDILSTESLSEEADLDESPHRGRHRRQHQRRPQTPSDSAVTSTSDSATTKIGEEATCGDAAKTCTAPAALSLTTDAPPVTTWREAAVTTPLRCVTVLSVPHTPIAAAVTATAAAAVSCASPNPQGQNQVTEVSESEVRRRISVRWVADKHPPFLIAAKAAAVDSPLLPTDPLTGHHAIRRSSRTSQASSWSRSQMDHEPHPRSPYTTSTHSLHSFLPPYVLGWSAEASVDVPLDLCSTAHVTASPMCHTDSPTRTTEDSLSTDVSGFAGCGADYSRLTSAVFRQMNSFSRSLGSAAASRRGSAAVVDLASVTNSVLMRVSAATFASSATRTTTTTTTTAAAAMAADVDEAMRDGGAAAAAARTVTTTTAVSSTVRVVVASQEGDDAAANNDDGAAPQQGVDDAVAMDARLLDDPDAPPFAKAALHRLMERSHMHPSSNDETTTTAKTTADEVDSRPRRTHARSQGNVAECAVSLVVATTAAQSCTTEMHGGRCPATIPPLSPPPSSTALVPRGCGEGDLLRPCLKKAVGPCVSDGNPLSSLEPMTALEIHLPKVPRGPRQHSRKRINSRDFCIEL